MKIETRNFEWMFYSAFGMMAFMKGFAQHSGNWQYWAAYGLASALLIMRVILTKKFSIKAGVLLLLAVGTFLIGGETTILYSTLFIVAAKDINFEKMMKLFLATFTFAVALRVILYHCGLVPSGEKLLVGWLTSDGNAKWVSGYGFLSPNLLYACLIIIIMVAAYVFQRQINLYTFLLISSLIMFFAYAKLACRTGIAAFCGFGFLLISMNLVKSKKIRISLLLAAISACVFISAIFPAVYNEKIKWLRLINKYLSARPAMIRNVAENAPVTLWGKNHVFLDNMYADTLYNSGIIGLVLIVVVCLLILYKMIKTNDWVGAVCVVTMMVYATMEQFPLNISMNPFLVYFGTDILYEHKIMETTEIVEHIEKAEVYTE